MSAEWVAVGISIVFAVGAIILALWALRSARRAQYKAPEVKHYYRVRLPEFGAPVRTIYRSADFDIPLVCPSCRIPLKDGQPCVEIPITNEAPGSVIALHEGCEWRPPQ